MNKLLVTLLAGFLAVGIAQAATTSRSTKPARHRRGDVVMSLTRPKSCSLGPAKRSVGCMAPAVAERSDAPDTRVMGDTGERHVATQHRAKRRHRAR